MSETQQHDPNVMYVRIKPYNKRLGHTVQRYSFRGVKFDVKRGWSTVDRAFAEELRKVRQDDSDRNSPKVFDVCTREEAERLEQEEAQTGPVAVAAATAAAGGVQGARREVPRPATDRAAGRPERTRRDDSETRRTLSDFDKAWDDDGAGTTNVQKGTTPEASKEMLDPDPEGKELEDGPEDGRVAAVGRLTPVAKDEAPMEGTEPPAPAPATPKAKDPGATELATPGPRKRTAKPAGGEQ